MDEAAGRLGEKIMTNRRLGGFAFALAAFGLLTCGCIPGIGGPDNGNPASNTLDDTTDDTPQDDGDNTDNHVVIPSSETSVSDLKNVYVLSAPIVGASLAGDVAGQFTALSAPLISAGWGSGALRFEVPGMDWLPVVKNFLTDAAGRGGLIQTYYLPLSAVRAGPIGGNLLDLAPAPGMSTVGVLPIIFVSTDFEGYPASGAGLSVELWSQQATCATCAYADATRYQHEVTPLISSIEIRQLRELGLWNDRVIAIIPKAGVWWARSEDAGSRVRNWMIVQPIGGTAAQVRCLTDAGNWPG